MADFRDETFDVVNILTMKSWVKLLVVAVFVFLWCYLTFTGLVKLPELDILKVICSTNCTFQILV